MDKQITHNLACLIARDLVAVGKLPLFLLILILATAIAIVVTTHYTRQAITEKDQTLVERDLLDSEWRNVILEETALAEHSRVQEIAEKELQMKRPDSDKEIVVSL